MIVLNFSKTCFSGYSCFPLKEGEGGKPWARKPRRSKTDCIQKLTPNRVHVGLRESPAPPALDSP